MTETTLETTQIQEQQSPNPFDEQSWETPVNEVAKTEEVVTKTEEVAEEVKQEPTLEVKTEVIPEVKPETIEVKAEVKEEIKPETKKTFLLPKENEDEVFEFLKAKKNLEKLTSVEVTADTAAEIVKLGMKNRYKDLTDAEINYKYNKSYALPKEPMQTIAEDDDDFAARKQEWEEKVNDIQTELLIEAKLTKPELDKYKEALVLPDILKAQAEAEQPTQEELALAKNYFDQYLKNVETSINSLDGFNVEYKDEEVSIPLNYSLSVEEKKSVADKMKSFAENGYNANTVFAERWLNADGSINTTQMANDIARLETGDKAAQKFVNDGVAKRLVEYRKQVSNIQVDGGNTGSFQPVGEKTDNVKMAEHFFEN